MELVPRQKKPQIVQPFFGVPYIRAIFDTAMFSVFTGRMTYEEMVESLARFIELEVTSMQLTRPEFYELFNEYLKRLFMMWFPDIPFPDLRETREIRRKIAETLMKYWTKLPGRPMKMVTNDEKEQFVGRLVDHMIVVAGRALFAVLGVV